MREPMLRVNAWLQFTLSSEGSSRHPITLSWALSFCVRTHVLRQGTASAVPFLLLVFLSCVVADL
jgi:hypothetical protein